MLRLSSVESYIFASIILMILVQSVDSFPARLSSVKGTYRPSRHDCSSLLLQCSLMGRPNIVVRHPRSDAFCRLLERRRLADKNCKDNKRGRLNRRSESATDIV